MNDVVPIESLAFSPTAFLYEGHAHGSPGIDASVFDTRSEPGDGPGLHVHPYPELFLVELGEVTFRVAGEELRVTAGHVLVVPAQTPHAFTNTGTSPSRVVSIHPRGRIEQTWLEDD
jgi:quercetin dioxygenase-like cupin family protein